MDTFFTIYFIVVGVLLFLKLIYKLIIFLKGDVDDWQRELSNDVLNWCLYLYPIRKQKPLLTLVDGKSHLAGEYCFYSNTITIYSDNNVLHRELINTVIHEYFHYYLITSESKSKLYHDQLEQFSLAHHPQEILCNTMGETLTKLYLKNK
ncbi:hypothetical protein ATE90_2267 [Polaribacter sp. Hel1_33_96]|jgi:hypothetical protein|nr:hypothetical protein ATE90_2267 [Polaribacter sp. Hel1_33_96]